MEGKKLKIEELKQEATRLGEELKKEPLPEKMMRTHENMKLIRG